MPSQITDGIKTLYSIYLIGRTLPQLQIIGRRTRQPNMPTGKTTDHTLARTCPITQQCKHMWNKTYYNYKKCENGQIGICKARCSVWRDLIISYAHFDPTSSSKKPICAMSSIKSAQKIESDTLKVKKNLCMSNIGTTTTIAKGKWKDTVGQQCTEPGASDGFVSTFMPLDTPSNFMLMAKRPLGSAPIPGVQY